MIEKCAGVITDWLISYGVIKKTDKELYSYAVYSIFLTLSPLLLAIGFGVVMGCVRQSIMIIIPFMIIRKFSGGYHARHSWSCLIGSCLLLLLCIISSFHVRWGWGIILPTLGASVSLVCLSPIDSENRVLSSEEHSQYKKVTAVIVVIFLAVVMLFFRFQAYTYSICTSIGMMLAAGLQYPCIFRVLRRSNEKTK